MQYRKALVNDESTSEINYEDSADSSFEPYIEETLTNKALDENQKEKIVLVN